MSSSTVLKFTDSDPICPTLIVPPVAFKVRFFSAAVEVIVFPEATETCPPIITTESVTLMFWKERIPLPVISAEAFTSPAKEAFPPRFTAPESVVRPVFLKEEVQPVVSVSLKVKVPVFSVPPIELIIVTASPNVMFPLLCIKQRQYYS